MGEANIDPFEVDFWAVTEARSPVMRLVGPRMTDSEVLLDLVGILSNRCINPTSFDSLRWWANGVHRWHRTDLSFGYPVEDVGN